MTAVAKARSKAKKHKPAKKSPAELAKDVAAADRMTRVLQDALHSVEGTTPVSTKDDMDTEPVLGGEKADVVTDTAPPAQPTKLPLGDDLSKYVVKGMDVFIPKLMTGLAEICDADRPASEFAQVYINLRGIQDVINALNKQVNAVEAKMAEFTIPTCFAREKLKSFTTDNGYRVGTSKTLRASILKERREAAYKWLRANGLPDLITETVNAGTLISTAKDMLEEGKELPEALFNVAYVDNTSLTKVKK
jgi:hypothetical protein